MKLNTITIFFMGVCILSSFALPVTQTKKDEKVETSTPESPDLEESLEYERYLKEVVAALESDSHFRAKLENASEYDIRSGNIAEQLQFVNNSVRLKLDELKRRELQRLKDLKEWENEIDGGNEKFKQHLDHHNVHTFEIDDLKKLIKKTSHDLEIAEQKRKQAFKEYEMEKKFEDEMKKKEMLKDQREKFEQEQKAMKEKHKKHPKMHHPGNKAQLEEVWEKQDHMDRSDFDPRKLFMLHDVDSNGYLDEDEVKALFVKELDKGYQADLPEDDMLERAEEMERMREEFFQEYDANKDRFISMEEFIERSKREEFNTDPEWDTIDKKPQFTHEEYLEFERRRLEDLQRRVARGELPPYQNMPQGYVQHGPNVVYQTSQQHPYGNQPQQPLHYEDPQQLHMQQQQQYQQQQQQYQQHQQQQYQYQQHQPQYQQQPHQYAQQQPQYPGKQVDFNPNQIPVQQQKQPQPQGVNQLPPQQQPQYQQHQYQYTQQQPQYPDQQVNSNPNQIPVQQYKQPQAQVVNQLPPTQQQQPKFNNLPPQQFVANNNLPPQQPGASNNLQQQQQQQQPVVSNNLPQQHQQQPVAINNLPPQKPVASNNLPQQSVGSSSGAQQQSVSNNMQPQNQPVGINNIPQQ